MLEVTVILIAGVILIRASRNAKRKAAEAAKAAEEAWIAADTAQAYLNSRSFDVLGKSANR